MRLVVCFFVFSLLICKMNINNLDPELLQAIPLDDSKVEAIIEFISFSNGIDNIYQLLELNEINAEDVKILKNYISVKPLDISEFVKNQKMSSYKLEWWFSSDGNQEGLSDIWLDRFFAPKDI